MTAPHDPQRALPPAAPPAPSRRAFLRGAGALAAAGWLPRFPLAAGGRRSPTALPLLGSAGDPAAGPPVLVMLELAGGNDGLNTVVPLGDDVYLSERAELAVTDALALTKGTGLHPALGGLRDRYEAGGLAVVQGVGYPDPQRSHFLSRDIWHTADPRGRELDTGWLGRLADAHFAQTGNPSAVVSLGTRVPYSCRAEHCQAVAVSQPAAFRVLGEETMVETLDTAVAADEVSDQAREFLRRAYMDARASSDAVRQAAESHEPGVDYPDTNLADDLELVAGLLCGGLDTRVVAVTMGGYDTHTKQVSRQRKLLAELDGALCAFLADLAAHGQGERVVVLVHSEFGRRVAANGSGGTDHGTAGPVFMAGGGVRGGLFGAAPDLGDLDERGDVRFTTDFRQVYATVLEGGLGVPAAPILGGEWETLGFLGA